MPKGYRKDGLLKVCRKGLHPFTEANTIYEANGVRRCLMCRADQRQDRERRRGRKPHPTETGVCRSGLHAWTEDNIVVDAAGVARCRPCREAGHRAVYARSHVIPCVVKGCERASHRADGGNYVCKAHRLNPPKWWSKVGRTISGTRLVEGPVHRPIEVAAGRWTICLVCHLLWPCYSGAILAAARPGESVRQVVTRINKARLAS